MPSGHPPEGMQRITVDISKESHQAMRTEVFERGNKGEKVSLAALVREALEEKYKVGSKAKKKGAAK